MLFYVNGLKICWNTIGVFGIHQESSSSSLPDTTAIICYYLTYFFDHYIIPLMLAFCVPTILNTTDSQLNIYYSNCLRVRADCQNCPTFILYTKASKLSPVLKLKYAVQVLVRRRRRRKSYNWIDFIQVLLVLVLSYFC